MNINKLLGILLIVAIGCSTSMVGKQMPPKNYAKVSPKLQHIYGKLLAIEFRTDTDNQLNTSMAKGTITINYDALPPGTSDLGRINMKILLMDINYTVIREVVFVTPVGPQSFAPIPFEVAFPYDPAFRYIYFTFKISVWH
jgi:hypothetical protein